MTMLDANCATLRHIAHSIFSILYIYPRIQKPHIPLLKRFCNQVFLYFGELMKLCKNTSYIDPNFFRKYFFS